MSRIAGHVRFEDHVVHVNYKDILEQAVENERWRIIREVEVIAKGIKTTTPAHRTYATEDPRPAREYRDDLIKALDAIVRGDA